MCYYFSGRVIILKDFPVFTTEFGAASLILKEVPYRKEAYIRIQSTEDPEKLLEECLSFCRICGAEKIYASGHPHCELYPLHTVIYEMRGTIPLIEDEIPSMFPVTSATVAQWRELYNRKMRNVHNASTLEEKDETKILESGGAYFIHHSGDLLGIGWIQNDRIEAIASVKHSGGVAVCKALQSIDPSAQLSLEVASTNEKAIQLYENLGFLKTAEISRWYQIL